MKIRLLILVIVLSAIIYSLPNSTFAAARPFGGLVKTIQPCNTGLLLYVNVPLQGVQPFMWFTGNLPYLMRIPPHPGQWLLGMAGTAVVPCILGIYYQGAGQPILYHGSSI
jgi:hypothetical protein